MDKNELKKTFRVVKGGKTSVEGNEGGPNFGSGIKAEETRDERKPLTQDEIEAMRQTEPLGPSKQP